MLKRNYLVYPQRSYKIIGILYEVFNELGYGHKEKYYQNAVVITLDKEKIKFERELYTPVQYKNKTIGRYFLDFLIEGKVVLELKQGEQFSRSNINQVYSYLKSNNLQLGIIANFTSKAVKYRRIVNLS